MSAPATASTADSPAPKGAEGRARALIERQLEGLGRLAEAGLTIAQAVERQVMAAEAAPGDAVQMSLGEAALAYGRVSRAVRLTIALQSRLVTDLQALDEAADRRRAGQQAQAGRERQAREEAQKDRVDRIVERLIRAEVSDEAEVDRLAETACERLEHDDIYGDILARPVREIVALVCRDLGLAPDWDGLSQEAWAQDEIDGGAAASPRPPLRWLDAPDRDAVAADPRARPPRAASP
jgi:hypothetical protein